MEEGSRRGIYGERIPLCRGVSSGSCRSFLRRPLEIFAGRRELDRGRKKQKKKTEEVFGKKRLRKTEEVSGENKGSIVSSSRELWKRGDPWSLGESC